MLIPLLSRPTNRSTMTAFFPFAHLSSFLYPRSSVSAASFVFPVVGCHPALTIPTALVSSLPFQLRHIVFPSTLNVSTKSISLLVVVIRRISSSSSSRPKPPHHSISFSSELRTKLFVSSRVPGVPQHFPFLHYVDSSSWRTTTATTIFTTVGAVTPSPGPPPASPRLRPT